MTIHKATWDPSTERCLACGGERLERFRADAHDATPGEMVNIIECLSCQFAWQYPPSRSVKQSVDHFVNNYSPTEGEPTGYFNSDYKKQTVDLQLQFLRTLSIGGRSLLDIGGGSGAFAAAAAQFGWHVTAVDPALNLAGLVNSNVQAIRGTSLDIPTDQRFDVITLWDVIEHLADPWTMLCELRGRLRPGGWLVLETGNYKSAGRVDAGLSHWIYQADHRWYFSPESLAALMRAADFTVEAQADQVLRPGWSGRAVYAGPSIKSLLGRIYRRPLGLAAEQLRLHQMLRRAMHWPQAGLEIFCIAGRMA